MTFIYGIGSCYAILDEDDVALGQVHILHLVLGIVYHVLRDVQIIIAIVIDGLESVGRITVVCDGVIPLRRNHKEAKSCEEIGEVTAADLTAFNIILQVVGIGRSESAIIC